MNSQFQKLKEKNLKTKDVYKPEFFRLKNEDDKKRFIDLTGSANVFLNDELYDQLKELVKSRNPTVFLKAEDYPKLIEQHIGDYKLDEYGVWVYYPWNNFIVHTLDEDEFIEVRTSRNQYKITNREREVLAQKKVGVIGLSVGQSVAVTMAMERTCGELRLADFDVLELTNLNRIRTGIRNLGLKKVVSVAREIAELDPYIKVVCYPDGISDENIDNFFCDGGKLDLLIDECDGLEIKVLCRIKAKGFRIPVVMEASDRGTIDIERFDLHPDRSILHGYIDHLDTSKIKDLKTNEEKIPYLLPIVGIETLSKRAKASMVEVGQTITTWPQLASAVTLGGGIVTDICRRIFLDEYHDSGRYFIDIEELICDKNKPVTEPHQVIYTEGVTEPEMKKLIRAININPLKGQTDLNKDVVKELVQTAILAPSGGNAQPWKWKYDNRNLYLFINSEYEPKLVDFKNTASYIGLGAATENLVLKAHQLNLEVKIQKFPLGETSNLVSVFHFFSKEDSKGIDGLELHIADDLVSSIPKRTVNRKITPKHLIETERLEKLVKMAQSVPGCNLSFLTESKDLADISEIIGKADRMRIMHKKGHLEFMAEIKWTEEEAEKTKKGIDINSLDLSPGQISGFAMVKDWEVVEYLNKWQAGGALERLSRSSANTASAIGLITMPSFDMNNFYEGGRALERIWLAATSDNIAFNPLTTSTFLFNRHLYEGAGSFSENVANELVTLRKEFQRIFSINDKFGEILLFRVFISESPNKRSLRAPVEEVLSFN
jgi:tRNA A37 threonylcarbamoyladenosine dehydratase